MKRTKLSRSKKWILGVTILILLLTVTISISLAWFTKEVVDDNFDLNFANVDIGLTGENGDVFEFEILSSNSRKKLMPGDTISSKIRVTNLGEVACYYLVCLKSNELNLETDFIYNSSTQISNSDNKALGVLETKEYHILDLASKIDENLTEQGIIARFTCSVYAIQTRNITLDTAYNELIKLKNS